MTRREMFSSLVLLSLSGSELRACRDRRLHPRGRWPQCAGSEVIGQDPGNQPMHPIHQRSGAGSACMSFGDERACEAFIEERNQRWREGGRGGVVEFAATSWLEVDDAIFASPICWTAEQPQVYLEPKEIGQRLGDLTLSESSLNLKVSQLPWENPP